jgi:type III pantothenate kinase
VTTLLIDAGNSRLKWAVLEGGHLGRSTAAPWNARNLAGIARRVFRRSARLDAVLVCAVAGSKVKSALRAAARAAGAPSPRFVASSHAEAGVTNAYRVPQRLGVDRWVALIGAHERFPHDAVCIISIGTAVTIDLIDSHGVHRGGAIVPGPRLMIESLLKHTALIRRRAAAGVAGPVRQLFAHDTRAALEAGSLHACVALVHHAMREAQELLQQQPQLLLTGGGAAAVHRMLLKSDGSGPTAVMAEDLVLSGLTVLAGPEPR